MKINLDQPLMDYEGNPITDADDNAKEIPLRKYLITALNAMLPNEMMSAEDKNKIFQISLKLNAPEADFTIDDRVFIKNRVARVQTPLVVGRITQILEGEDS